MRVGVPHSKEWFARFRKVRPVCLICPNRVKKPKNRMCSVSCSNRYKYQDKTKHPNWRGGITKGYRAVRSSMSWALEQWRLKVLERDGHKCTQCGSTERLEADHIKSFWFYPETRLDVSNGRTLCNPCHRKTDNYGIKAHKGLLGTQTQHEIHS